MISEPEKYEPIVKLVSLDNDNKYNRTKVFLVPGVEGKQIKIVTKQIYLNELTTFYHHIILQYL